VILTESEGLIKTTHLVDDKDGQFERFRHKLSSDMQSDRHLGRKPPPCANGLPLEAIINYDEFSSPGADDYIIDADYPIESYLKKSGRRHTGEPYSNRPEF
jgi:hypothetical protein